MTTRTPQQIFNGRPSTDGAGVKILRVLGEHRYDLDPFLMLDEIRSDNSDDYIGGFPPHPHRGIETFTYMIAGGFVHEDHLGNRAELRDGGAQWMSTGHGIIHSELPLVKDGLLHGFQLWINLPAKQKLKKPEYDQITSAQIPLHHFDNGVTARALGGTWQFDEVTLTSPLNQLASNARILDLQLAAGATFSIPTPSQDTVLVFVFEGSLANPSVRTRQLVRFTAGDRLELTAAAEGARLLLLIGTPLHEPIVQHGPFVMNTEEEIMQAINDYKTGKLTEV
jgi:hypothetical protein